MWKKTSKPMSFETMLKEKIVSNTAVLNLTADLEVPQQGTTESLADTGTTYLHKLPPEDDDFIYRQYRALSAIQLQDRPVDWSHDPSVLKEALPLFKQKSTGHKLPLYLDHNMDVDKFVGIVHDAFWDESASPHGIDQIFAIDKTMERTKDVVRGVQIGAINSASVTIRFKWKKSHPEMGDEEFFENAFRGKVIDGQRVRALPTKIEKLYETSLVSEGADPMAKSKQNAVLDYVNSFVSEEQNNNGVLPPNHTDGGKAPKGADSMEKFKQVLEAALGLYGYKVEDALSDEQIANLCNQLPTLVSERDAANEKLAEAQKDIDKLKADLTAKSAVADAYVTRLRNDLSTAAIQALGDDNGKVIVEMAASPTITVQQLEQLAQIYQRQAEEKFPQTCPKCGVKVERQSSAKLSEPDAAKPPVKPPVPATPGASELASKFRNKQ